MKLQFPPFQDFINHSTTQKTQDRRNDSQILNINVEDNHIEAQVRGTFDYTVKVDFNKIEVISAQCSCYYDHDGYCKHIVNVLAKADKIIAQQTKRQSQRSTQYVQRDLFGIPEKVVLPSVVKDDMLVIPELDLRHITSTQLKALTPKPNYQSQLIEAQMQPQYITAFFKDRKHVDNLCVTLEQENGSAILSCTCQKQTQTPCAHQYNLLKLLQEESQPLRLAFDADARFERLSDTAAFHGLINPSPNDLDELYELNFHHNRLFFSLKEDISLFSPQRLEEIKSLVLPEFQFPQNDADNPTKEFLVFVEEDYIDYYLIGYFKAPLTKAGKIKSPITSVDVVEKLNASDTKETLKFYSAFLHKEESVNYLDQNFNHKALLANPLELELYYVNQNDRWFQKIKPKQLEPIQLQSINPEIIIKVKQRDNTYILTCKIVIDGKSISPKQLKLRGRYAYIKKAATMYYLENKNVLNLIDFFAQQKASFSIHRLQFDLFKTQFLDPVENLAEVQYDFIKPAPKKIIKAQGIDKIEQFLIYLSDSENYITLTPAVRYGDLEVSILSKRNLYTTSPSGEHYTVKRNFTVENRFLRNIQAQHPDFEELPETDFFYLHKQEFLDEGWFLDAFEAWRADGYDILGFKQLKNNHFNPFKINVSTQITSGIDWFDVHTEVKFGAEKVNLKTIQKSVRNHTKYIPLGDGTQGILPQEWVDKFSAYFRSSEIKGDAIRTHKSNFQLIDQLFEREVLSEETRLELDAYQQKLKDFKSITAVEPPKLLNAQLRDYQKEGLNWLNFLDEFGFGGCLADDMGLGKTVQLIAYILKQHEKGRREPNLIVLPTSLLFNWQNELDKFAPHLNYYVHYGANRSTEQLQGLAYDLVLTSYGTLLSDIEILKDLKFNLIILDESQAIKNPNSKRYRAVRLLQARQRLVATGTPIENNTFDLYAQLSFAIPGLLGSQKQFKDNYATPIDQFQNDKRAQELQQKVHPFILRRTKKQVANELPEKTEMIIRCEMSAEQRRVYNTYKTEFQNYLSGASDEELSSSSLHILQGLTKLRQICNSPALLADEDYYGESSAKLDLLMEQITELKDDHKILVFSQFVGMLDLIKTRLDKEKIGHAYLTGKTRKRQAQVDDFQNNPDTRVFLISLKAGGTGLNLTEAEYVFIVDPWWNPAVENQAIDRAYRIGQHQKVMAIRLITPDSIEEKILTLQEQKLQLVEDLIHTDHNAFKKLTKQDLLSLV